MPPLLLIPDAALMHVRLEAPRTRRPKLALDPFVERLKEVQDHRQRRLNHSHHRHEGFPRKRATVLESCDLLSADRSPDASIPPKLRWLSSCDSYCSTVSADSLPTPSSTTSTASARALSPPSVIESTSGKKTVRYDFSCDPMSVAATAPPISSSLLDCSSYTSYTLESEMPLPLITSVSLSKVPKCDAMNEHATHPEDASLYAQRICLLPWRPNHGSPLTTAASHRSLNSSVTAAFRSPPFTPNSIVGEISAIETPPGSTEDSRSISLGEYTPATRTSNLGALDLIAEVDDRSSTDEEEVGEEFSDAKKLEGSFSTKSTDATDESRQRPRDPTEWERIVIWAKNITNLLSVERVDEETTCILMQAAEQRHSGRMAKSSALHSRPALLSAQKMSMIHRWGSSVEVRRTSRPRGRRRPWFLDRLFQVRSDSSPTGATSMGTPSMLMSKGPPTFRATSGGGSPMSLTQYLGEHKGHYRRVLGENRYLRVRTGVLVWVFFIVLTKLEKYRFFLSSEGEIMISKAHPTNSSLAPPTGCFPRRRRRRANGSSLPRENTPCNEAKPLPLDRLRAIDISHEALQILQEPALAAVRATAVCALWNDQSNEPLLIASNRQADIEDIVFLIRFVQQYKGLELAHVYS